MIYQEIEGDLLNQFQLNQFDLIAHGCNCFHTFGSGIAKQIRESYPEAWKSDLQTEYANFNKLGNYSGAFVRIGDSVNYHEKTILNCYIQYNYGREKVYLDYDAISLCFKKINVQYKGKTIGLPLIGCGSAGGDWKKVKSLMQENLKDMGKVIVIMYDKKEMK